MNSSPTSSSSYSLYKYVWLIIVFVILLFTPQKMTPVWFYGISTIIGYLMPNPFYTYLLNMYDL